MRAFKKVLVYKNKISHISCNFCGEAIKANAFGYSDEHVSVEKKWGYGSPRDGESHSFEICADCYEKLVKTMKIPPEIE